MHHVRILLLAALLAGAPLALAHDPPAPVLGCQGPADGRSHDYLPPGGGDGVLARDGNLGNCRAEPVSAQALRDDGLACSVLPATTPGACDKLTLPADRPAADYDGEPDHAAGGALLFVETGDGAGGGVAACYGAPSLGHHPAHGPIYARDVTGSWSAFRVAADHARLPPPEGPDCGDGLLEPCETPEAPRTGLGPADDASAAVRALAAGVLEQPGVSCNPSDRDAPCVAGCVVPFGPGADGAYRVRVTPASADDADLAIASGYGHVYTSDAPDPELLGGPGPLVVTVTWDGDVNNPVQWTYEGSFTCAILDDDHPSFRIECTPDDVIQFHCVNPGVAVIHSQGASYGRTRVDLDCGTISGGCEVWYIGSCVQYLGGEQWDTVVCRGGYDIVVGEPGNSYPPMYEVACYSDPPQMPQPPVPLTVGGSPP